MTIIIIHIQWALYFYRRKRRSFNFQIVYVSFLINSIMKNELDYDEKNALRHEDKIYWEEVLILLAGAAIIWVLFQRFFPY